MQKKNIKKLIYAASSSCYGIPKNYPTSENSPISPQYPYALSKILGEKLVMHWAKVYNMPNISLRFFNVYGPRSRTTGAYGAVFGVFLAQKLANYPLTIVGDGQQTRDFTYVEDIVDGCLLAAEKPINDGTPINLGTGRRYKINEVVEMICEILNWKPKEFSYEKDKPVGVLSRALDNSRAEDLLGWKPKYTLKEGLAKTIEWYISTHKTTGNVENNLLLEHS